MVIVTVLFLCAASLGQLSSTPHAQGNAFCRHTRGEPRQGAGRGTSRLRPHSCLRWGQARPGAAAGSAAAGRAWEGGHDEQPGAAGEGGEEGGRRWRRGSATDRPEGGRGRARPSRRGPSGRGKRPPGLGKGGKGRRGGRKAGPGAAAPPAAGAGPAGRGQLHTAPPFRCWRRASPRPARPGAACLAAAPPSAPSPPLSPPHPPPPPPSPGGADTCRRSEGRGLAAAGRRFLLPALPAERRGRGGRGRGAFCSPPPGRAEGLRQPGRRCSAAGRGAAVGRSAAAAGGRGRPAWGGAAGFGEGAGWGAGPGCGWGGLSAPCGGARGGTSLPGARRGLCRENKSSGGDEVVGRRKRPGLKPGPPRPEGALRGLHFERRACGGPWKSSRPGGRGWCWAVGGPAERDVLPPPPPGSGLPSAGREVRSRRPYTGVEDSFFWNSDVEFILSVSFPHTCSSSFTWSDFNLNWNPVRERCILYAVPCKCHCISWSTAA